MAKKNYLKSIEFMGEISGHGIVNYDSGEQKYYAMRTDLNLPRVNGMVSDNVNYAKKNFYEVGEGKLDYKLKISSDCFRHVLFGTEKLPPHIKCDSLNYVMYLLSPVGLVRGYLFAGRDGTEARKGSFRVTDAEQTNDAKSSIEIHSKSGVRDENSLHYRESVGDITYGFEGDMDMKLLQFVSCDHVFDRCALPKDCIENGFVDTSLSSHYHWLDLNSISRGFFKSKTIDTGEFYPEYGLLLSNDLCKYLIRYVLKRMLSWRLSNANGNAKVSSLKIRLKDSIFDNDSPWIELKSCDDIDNLEIPDIHYFYEKANSDDVERYQECSLRKEVNDAQNKLNDAKSALSSLLEKKESGKDVSEKQVESARKKVEKLESELDKKQVELSKFVEDVINKIC